MKREWMNAGVVEETVELVLAFDRDGGISYGNHSALEKLDYTEEELLSESMCAVFRQEFQKEDGSYADFDRELLKDGQETVMYRKNNACFPVMLRLFADEDGGGYLLAEDIAYRKNTDVRIRQLKEEEEANQKARNEFTANVTHELRTPVNGIKGHVMALSETVQDAEVRKTLDIILYCCDNMSAIINNILDFSKMEAGKFTLDEHEFDFYKMMEQIIATHTVAINKKELQLRVHMDETIPQRLIGDELRVGQILNNLLSNAVKFTTVGQVSVDVSRTMQTGDEVELFFMVRDSGIGISREEQDKLFQSFKQVDASITRRFGGTGLGLSITKQLVEMMHGSIHVESEKGKGSCFSFSVRLRTGENVDESRDMSETYRNWNSLTESMEETGHEERLTFGTKANREELRKRLEKLVLSIELDSWDKAETLAQTIKTLAQDHESDLKRPILQLEMALRKENYDKSIAAYERVKETIDTLLENAGEARS
ncbi:MAG: ATP-binding protein [Clostridium sp.]|nr:ATP-binding protein [Clostridium sp.]